MKNLRSLLFASVAVMFATTTALAQQTPTAPSVPPSPTAPVPPSAQTQRQQTATQPYYLPTTTTTRAYAASGVPVYIMCQMYAQRKRLSLVILPGTPNPVVSTVIRNLSGEAAFSQLLKYNGLSMRVQNNTLFIGAPSSLDIQFNTGDTRIATIPVSGVDPAVIANNAQYFTTPGTIIWPDAAHHAIVVRGTPTAIEQLREDIAKFEPTSFVSYNYQLSNGQDPKDVYNMIALLDPPGGPDVIVPDSSNDGILIRGTPDYVSRVRSDLASYVDHPRDAVTYDATIYEVDPDTFDSNRGITVGQSQQQFSAVGSAAVAQIAPPIPGQAIIGFPFSSGVNLSMQLNALEERGKATILRRATVIAANGTESGTAYTEDVPYPITDQYTGVTTIRTVASGVTFKVVPSIGQHNLLTKVYIDYSDIAGSGAQGAPIVAHRQSQVTVPTYGQDQAIVVSGLYADDATDTMRGIPPLNHLPLVGGLFRNHQTTHNHAEIVLVLIPHVMSNGPGNHVPIKWPNVPQDILQRGIQPESATPQATPYPHSRRAA